MRFDDNIHASTKAHITVVTGTTVGTPLELKRGDNVVQAGDTTGYCILPAIAEAVGAGIYTFIVDSGKSIVIKLREVPATIVATLTANAVYLSDGRSWKKVTVT